MPIIPRRLQSRALLAGLVLLAAGARAVPPPLGVSTLAGKTPREIAVLVAGCDVEIFEATRTGAAASFGYFTGGTGIVGFDTGIVISTGVATAVAGPNSTDGTTGTAGTSGDPQLTAMSGQVTNDAAILEFEFKTSATQVTFEYTFGSEEYNEYVNSVYNDVFAFYVNDINVATVPGSTFFITINNVNNGNPIGTGATNPQYYLDNARDSATIADPVGTATRFWGTELDGLTVVFTVTATVVPDVINHMRFAIADGFDNLLDSAVFIKAGSLSGGGPCPGPAVPAGTITPAVAEPVVAYPNPYRPASTAGFAATTVTIRGLTAGSRLRIHAPGGRLVVELTDADVDGVVVWDVRDADGTRVPSGVYLVLATAPDGTIRRTRIVVVQ